MSSRGGLWRAGGILLSAVLLTVTDLGGTVVWAAQAGRERSGYEEEAQTSFVSGGDRMDLPFSVSGNTLSGNNALREGVVWSGNLGNTVAVTKPLVAKWWKDGIAPAAFQDAWIPAANVPKDGKFQLSVVNTEEGAAVYCRSEDSNARYDMMNKTDITGLDYSKDYILSAYVKTKDVTGTGFYIRSQVGGNLSTIAGEGRKVKGTTQGWELYELPLKDIAAKAPDAAGKMKIEVFFEKLAGEVWVKDIELREDYSLELNMDTARMSVGDKLSLKAVCNNSSIDLGQLVWESSDSGVAKITGAPDAAQGEGSCVITAEKGGNCVITARMPDGHFAECTILVSDPLMEADYEKMREKWTERLTGNSFWMGEDTSEEYKAVVAGYDEKVQEILNEFVESSDTQLFSTLDLTLKEGSASTDSNDSVDLSEAVVKIQYLARAYACEGSAWYQNEELKDKILYAFKWVHSHIYHENLDNRARYGNWFHWWISMPQNLAGAAILMYDELIKPENLQLFEGINATLAHFNEDPGYVYQVKGANGNKLVMTGANLADTCLASVLRSALASDQEGIVRMAGYFPQMVQVATSGEGIYPDGSFIQHKNVAYTGGYGATLLNGTEKLIYLTAGTSWEIPAQQTAVLFDWILEGIRPLYADGAMFDMVSGRSVARPNRSDYTTGRGILAGVALLSKSAPEEIRPRIESFVKKQLTAGARAMGEDVYYQAMNAAAMMESLRIVNDESVAGEADTPYAKVFGGMDKAVAHSGNFSAGFSLASARTRRFEFGNNENSMGWHQSDGMLYLYNGDSSQFADNYWNTVDPHRLPGITTDHSGWKPEQWGDYTGNANYNGGAALGQYAAVAMNFKNHANADNSKLTAKKTWFVFDNEILCMGAGITGIDKSRDTETIVENKKVRGDNELLINGRKYPDGANISSMEEEVSWAWLEGNTGQDAVGYYFPEGSDVFVKREERTGSFRDINNGNQAVDDAQATRNYVSLALKHGEYADGKIANFKYENYGYVLLPGMKAEQVEAYSGNPDIEILANNAYVQAAYDRNADVYSYVFWQPSTSGKVEKALRVGDVESDYATIVMQRDKEAKTLTLEIADPLQNRDKVTVRLYGNGLKLLSADENISVVKTDKYGVVLEVATKGTLGATFQAVFTYEEQSGELLEEYRRIRERYTDSLTGNSFTDKNDPEYRTVMNGYTKLAQEAWDSMVRTPERTTLWEDLDITLDYTNKGTSNNDSAAFETTTYRINNMALAWASSGSSLYHNEQLGNDIIGAISFVLEHYPPELADKVYGNWWHWDIGVPRDLCDITLLMYDELDEGMRDELYRHLDTTVPFASHCWMRGGSRPYLYTTTAANTMDISVIRALTGMIGNDSKGLYMASDQLPAMMKYVSKGDGFYKDGSYVQHGTLAYTGGYGADALRGVTKIFTLTGGTPWACTEADPNIVYEWIVNGFRPLFADGASFEMVAGRQISRYRRSDITTARYIMDAVLQLAEAAPEEYKDVIFSFAKTQLAEGIAYDREAYYSKLSIPSLIMAKKLLADDTIPEDHEAYTKLYTQMDKAVTHGKDFALGISMYSSRRANAECGNSENFKGWFTADGMTYLYNGDRRQYNDNYWPTVDMTRLAGITTNHVTGDLGNFSAHLSPNSWVGGSTVKNLYASVGMDFTAQFPAGGEANLTAKKSWFALGDQIVALGAGITSKDGDFTETIVENRKIDNDNILLADGEEAAAAVGDQEVRDIRWAWLSPNQEGGAVGYYFPEGSRVVMERADRTGKWQDINTSASLTNEESARDITRRYMTLAIEHGQTPENADYSYVLLPGKSDREMADYAKNNSIEILSNTAKLQAVRDTRLGVAGYNFWEAGAYQADQGADAYSVRAEQPVSMTVAQESGVYTFGFADPTQKSADVTVTVELDTKNLTIAGQDENVEVDLSQEGKAVFTVHTQDSHGASFTAVVADKAVAEALRLLNEAEATLDSALTTEDLEKVTGLQESLMALDATGLSGADKERAARISEGLAAVIRDMEAVMKAAADLETIGSVDKNNTDTVDMYLKAYDNLSDAQKELLTDAQKQTAEAVRSLWQEYQDSIDNEGGDNEGGDNEGGDNEGGDNEGGDNEGGDNEGDNNDPEATTPGETAQQAVEEAVKELEEAAETIRQQYQSGGTEEAIREAERLAAKITASRINWKQVTEDIRTGAAGAANGRRAIEQLAKVEDLIAGIFAVGTILDTVGGVPSGFEVTNALLSVSMGRNAVVTVEMDNKGTAFTLPSGSSLKNAASYILTLSEEGGGARNLAAPVIVKIPAHKGLELTADNLVVLHYYGDGAGDYEELPILEVGPDYVITVTGSFSTFVLANKDVKEENGGNAENEGGPDNSGAQETHGNDSGRKSPKTYDDSPFWSEDNNGTQAGRNGSLAAQELPEDRSPWAAVLILAVLLISGTGFAIYRKKREDVE